jgi:hypothetical protein
VSVDWRYVLRKRSDPWLSELHYGIECRNGWENLVAETLDEIAQAVGDPSACPELRIVRLRQKFGWLICQHRGLVGDQAAAVEAVLAAAMTRSTAVCEHCGRPGRQRDEDVAQDYWTVECDECRAGGGDG